MTQCLFRTAILFSLLVVGSTAAVPLPNSKTGEAITDRAGFIPHRKHLAVPGKVIGVLVTDAQPVLSAEGRSGPPDQLCLGWNGGSYRWVYVPVKEKAIITNLQVHLPGDKIKVYPSLNMANPATVKDWGIDTPYTLVEVEVNDGEGSPAEDAFVATKMKKLDGSKEFPIQIATVIADLRKQYQSHLTEKQKDLDAAMDTAAKKALKENKPTGPRETSTLMFVTWMPETERLIVRFRSTITDGNYKYGNGINIELPRPALPPGPPKGGAAAPPRLENGLRFGEQFGIEYGVQFEVHKSGKLERTSILEPQSFEKMLPPPPLGRGKQPFGLPVPVKR
ncbi:MAG: hypothetical protein K8T89_05130 [Planctomycetes bacterium]|nr:hypothetical protein [Planctomycetota bacterium]